MVTLWQRLRAELTYGKTSVVIQYVSQQGMVLWDYCVKICISYRHHSHLVLPSFPSFFLSLHQSNPFTFDLVTVLSLLRDTVTKATIS